MSEGADTGSEDFSGLSGFFFYVFIVHPATAWILRPGRFERKRSIIYAIAFLAGLAAIKTGTYGVTRLFCRVDRRDFLLLHRVVSPWSLPRRLDKLHV